MNIYLPLNGRAQIITPTPIYQGSVEIDTITVQSQLPRTTALELWFELPDEERTKAGAYIMAIVTPSSGTDDLNYWTATLDRSITVFRGVVNVVINARDQQNRQLTSYSCEFEVQPGMLPELPPQPTPDVYERLFILLQANTIAIELLDAYTKGELERLDELIKALDIEAIWEELARLEALKKQLEYELAALKEYKTQILNAIVSLEDRLLARIIALENRATAVENRATALEGATIANAANISSLTGRVTTAEGDITSLEGRVTVNEGNIAVNKADIQTGKTDRQNLWQDQARQDTGITQNRLDVGRHNALMQEIIRRVAALEAPTSWQDVLDREATWQNVLNDFAMWASLLLGRDHLEEIWEQITALWVAENNLENKVNANILVAKHYHKAFTNATFSGEVWIKEFTHNPDVASVSIWGYATETAVGTTGQAFAILDPTTYPLLQRFIDQVDQWARGYNSSTGVFSDMPVRITAANGIEIVTPPNIPVGTRFTWQFVLYLSDEAEVIEL